MQASNIRLGSRSHRTQWFVLVALSVVLIAILETLKLPGGIMIGAMIAAIVVATADGRIRMPTSPVIVVQGVVGVMIASTIPPMIINCASRFWIATSGNRCL